jgi:DHA2 family multidrug resistance protein
MNVWKRPLVAFIGSFCSAMGINALSNATALLAGRFQSSLSEISPATSFYLIAEIAALPLLPVVVAKFGAPKLLKAALWGFLVGSMLCLFAPTLDLLLMGRIVQGFFGGLLVTTPLLIMKSDLPEDKQPLAMVAAGILAGFAPIVGPLLTATLNTDNVQLIFLLMSALIIIALFIYPKEAGPNDLDSIDGDRAFPKTSVFAVFSFSAGLASIVWAIEHIQEWGAWNDVKFRMFLILGSAVILLAGLHQWRKKDALLPLLVLMQPKYTGILLSSMMMGVVVYGFLYLVPYYLIRVHGAGVEELFHVTLYATIPQLLWLPALLFLRGKLSPYTLVMLGTFTGLCSVWQLTDLGFDFGGHAWLLPQGLRAIAIPMIALPLGLLLIKLPSKEDAPALTSLYGLFRTMGGIVGVSGLTAYTESKQSQYAQVIMMNPDSVTLNSGMMERSAWLYAFNDTFYLISLAMAFMFAYFAWVASRQHSEAKNGK